MKTRRISSKKINNPFLKDRREKRFRQKCKLIAILVLILAVLLAYLFFASNTFKIKDIEIGGNSSAKDSIEELLNREIIERGKNILLTKKEDIDKLIKDYNIEDIKIQKILPKTIRVKIEERSDVYMYQEDNVLYFLDNDSYVSKKFEICQDPEVPENEFDQEVAGFDVYNTDIETNSSMISDCLESIDEIVKDRFMPLIVNMGAPRLDLDNNYVRISEEYLSFSKDLYNDLRFDSDFRAKNFILDESINTIKVNLQNGISILLNLRDDYMSQFQRFEDIKKSLKEELKNIKNIDMRYGDKIYYN